MSYWDDLHFSLYPGDTYKFVCYSYTNNTDYPIRITTDSVGRLKYFIEEPLWKGISDDPRKRI